MLNKQIIKSFEKELTHCKDIALTLTDHLNKESKISVSIRDINNQIAELKKAKDIYIGNAETNKYIDKYHNLNNKLDDLYLERKAEKINSYNLINILLEKIANILLDLAEQNIKIKNYENIKSFFNGKKTQEQITESIKNILNIDFIYLRQDNTLSNTYYFSIDTYKIKYNSKHLVYLSYNFNGEEIARITAQYETKDLHIITATTLRELKEKQETAKEQINKINSELDNWTEQNICNSYTLNKLLEL